MFKTAFKFMNQKSCFRIYTSHTVIILSTLFGNYRTKIACFIFLNQATFSPRSQKMLLVALETDVETASEFFDVHDPSVINHQVIVNLDIFTFFIFTSGCATTKL